MPASEVPAEGESVGAVGDQMESVPVVESVTVAEDTAPVESVPVAENTAAVESAPVESTPATENTNNTENAPATESTPSSEFDIEAELNKREARAKKFGTQFNREQCRAQLLKENKGASQSVKETKKDLIASRKARFGLNGNDKIQARRQRFGEPTATNEVLSAREAKFGKVDMSRFQRERGQKRFGNGENRNRKNRRFHYHCFLHNKHPKDTNLRRLTPYSLSRKRSGVGTSGARPLRLRMDLTISLVLVPSVRGSPPLYACQ